MRNNNINSTGTEIGNSKQISINIFSWNVNGLKDKDKINKILNFKHNNPGIYMFQEIHKINDYIEKRLNSGPCISYIKEGSCHSSGVATLIPNNEANLSQIPSSFNNHEQTDRILHGEINWFDTKILLINLYAPAGDQGERTAMFHELNLLLETLQPQALILGGDFNCILDPILDQQKKTKNTSQLNEQDQMALRVVINNYNLIDVWRRDHPDSNQCTYGPGNGPKISRLDRFYVSESIVHLIDSSTIINNGLADHNPIRITLLSPNGLQSFRSTWKLNAKVLLQNKFKTIVRSELNKKLQQPVDRDINTWYDKTKLGLRRQMRRYTIGNHNNLTALIQKVSKQIEELESKDVYQDIQEATNTINKIQGLKLRLNDLQLQAYNNARLNAATTSADTSERATNTFFNSVKEKQKNLLMSSIKRTDGTVAYSQHDISEASCRFYEDLYQERQTSPEHVNILLNTINKRVLTDDFRTLDQPITPEEVSKAITWLASGKAPGPDGLGSEYYKTFKDELSPVLASVYNMCIETQSLPNSMTNATICLLHKKGELQSLGNWRPISLLNVDYKIFALIINNRIKRVLPGLLNPDQKGFVPSRRLEDAILKATHLLEYCKRNNIPAYLMLLDQEKAFDRVSRDYLHVVMNRFGFPDTIKNAIKALYANTTAQIAINGQLSRQINLQSGVRQGCPLSPTLFALCIEPLGNLIRNNDSFLGIRIPNAGIFKISKFADDTTFILANQNDHDIARDAVKIYELGTAAKANATKTEILPIGPDTHSTNNPLTTDIKILPYDTDVRFLGVKIGNNVDTEAIWNEKIIQLEKTLHMWSKKFLTYEGRIFVLKQQALGSIWFQAKFHYLPPDKIKEIDKIIKNFINSGKLRSPINYNIMKLPKEYGGLGAPDINLYSQCIRISWIHALMDSNNKAEWKKLAQLEIDHFSNRLGLGANILQASKKCKQLKPEHGFWQANINFFQQLGGTYDPRILNLAYTPQRLMNEPISSFCDLEILDRYQIQNTKQVIKEIKPTGGISLHSPKSLKTNFSMARILGSKARTTLINSIPSNTVPPKYMLEKKRGQESILHEISNDGLEYKHKRLKLSPDHPRDENIYKYTDSPSKPYQRNIEMELNEVETRSTNQANIRVMEDKPSGPTINQLKAVKFTSNTTERYLEVSKLKHIYSINLIRKNKDIHHHYDGYNSLFTNTLDWASLSNQKLHPSIPKILKNYRFQILHNRLHIGRQLAHIPGIEPFKIRCQFCNHEPNTIEHLLVDCSESNSLWQHVEHQWQSIVGSYEDFTDNPVQIQSHTKFTGMEYQQLKKSPLSDPINYNKMVLSNALDIIIGNAQFSLIKIYKHYLNNQRSSEGQLRFLFNYQMCQSISKTLCRMKRPQYNRQWVFRKPKTKAEYTELYNPQTEWSTKLKILLKNTLLDPDQLDPTPIPTLNCSFDLTSELSPDPTSDI